MIWVSDLESEEFFKGFDSQLPDATHHPSPGCRSRFGDIVWASEMMW